MDRALIGTLAGVILGAALGFFGTLGHDWFATNALRKRVAAALSAEITENRLRFTGFAEHLQKLQPGQPLEEIFTRWSGQDFFPVYDNSTHHLGLFSRQGAAIIVHCVAQFKSLMERIDMIHLGESRHADFITQNALAGNDVAAMQETRRNIRVKDADMLRPALQRLLDDADKAIDVLKKYAKD